jgi:hypothetical protein
MNGLDRPLQWKQTVNPGNIKSDKQWNCCGTTSIYCSIRLILLFSSEVVGTTSVRGAGSRSGNNWRYRILQRLGIGLGLGLHPTRHGSHTRRPFDLQARPLRTEFFLKKKKQATMFAGASETAEQHAITQAVNPRNCSVTIVSDWSWARGHTSKCEIKLQWKASLGMWNENVELWLQDQFQCTVSLHNYLD